MRKRQILLLTLSPDIRDLLVYALAAYDVECPLSLNQATALCREARHGVLIVDIGQSGVIDDGLTLVRALRAENDKRWIIAISGETDRDLPSLCYRSGADGFVDKRSAFIPQLKCLVARFIDRDAVVSDRIDGMRLPTGPFRFGGAEIQPERMAISFETGRRVHLCPKEIGILSVFAGHSGQLVKRSDILNYVWGPSASPSSKSLDTYLGRLRSVYRAQGVEMTELIRPEPKVGWWVA